ncbi:T9SS type A sorting domain-containing protein [Catalinimonas niigatensis]|uniref:T9SS type A sorting domain-containing protein n=1 Tax=Catalinimonas niigatensis TaxID=1397264 RepID=UPI002665FA32|nr:T9SS type A sorting domain-containing protein [Catalinimonas niigatensis]WPP52554.1 hypothetical protein PZB72_09190 [Catalinimonas niigatensis]
MGSQLKAQDVAVYQLPLVLQDTSIQERVVDETNLKYSKNLLNQDFDFELNPLAQGKFSLNMLQDTKAMVSIKVYDIIGNLVYEENVKIRGSFKKEFDLSFLKTKFFIVEVGNKDFNKTKSIVVS